MTEESKWRIIGHGAVLSFLDSAMANGRIDHGYVFQGPDAIGKETVAMQFFAKLLKVDEDRLAVHPDLIIVERGINPKTKKQREKISIDQVQEARSRFQHSTLSGGWKLMLIKDAQLMTESASNALLKTLEEPRGNACIVMTTTNASHLLPTIRSRSQVVSFRPVAREDICDAIKPMLGSREEAHTIAGYAAGCPGAALNNVNNAAARDIMTENKEKARACLTGSASKRILKAKKLIPEYNEDHVVTRMQLLQRVNMIETIARDDLLRSIGCDDLVTDRENIAELDKDQAVASIKGAVKLKKQLAMHINPKMALINLMLNIG